MSGIVYYFTGTGNSLAIARDIAETINAELISISSVVENETVKTDADMIGIIFPVYHQGIPYIIKRFVNKMVNLDKKYVFGVCTYGDSPGISLEYLDKAIKSKGGRLSAGYGVRMPYNYLTPSFVIKDFFNSFGLREITIEKQQKMFNDWDKKLEGIKEDLQSRKIGKLETQAKIIEKLVDFLNLRETLQKTVWLKIARFEGYTNLSFVESLQLMDSAFNCDERCNGCGICSKICPVKNIKMVEGRPLWQHHCEQCFACLQWCPKETVQFRNGTMCGKRYHHPKVKLSDMLSQGECS
ncbi:iron-sulfur protein [Clostridium polyendosporum]|uniref:Iron-sulfur protein n=1 Tax=Clostridium polyendosporum TaxID=69208 RepID=A0A919S2C2_9CLOT|nr:EFR1 family ferrodoxin [Clostridium polyendosporum]GIM29968.1 iron-sulfur protein [Clostridium polyendosporum]